MDMIHIDDPGTTLSQRYLTAPGGFAWWYAEILDASRNGLVLIYSFGLPFLPGYMSAARRGRAPIPVQRPSLNLVLYEGGEPTFYLLREFEPERASWDGEGRWRFGDTHIKSWIHAGRRHLEVELNCPLDHDQGSVTGRIALDGQAVSTRGIPAPPSAAEHAWTPLALPATGSAELHLEGGREMLVSGSAYFDRNGGDTTLEGIGVDTWFWTRASLPEHERIAYALWPEGGGAPRVLAFEVSAEGEMVALPEDELELETPRRRRTLYGMPTWPWLEVRHRGQLWLRAEQEQRVDDGPFYLRYHTRASTASSWGEGSSEIIKPSRVDLARHRPLVKMRVSSEQRRNSMWTPLFEGSREGRLERMATRLVGAKPMRWLKERLG